MPARFRCFKTGLNITSEIVNVYGIKIYLKRKIIYNLRFQHPILFSDYLTQLAWKKIQTFGICRDFFKIRSNYQALQSC